VLIPRLDETEAVPRFEAYLAGEWQGGRDWIDVRSPIDSAVIARVPRIDSRQIEGMLDRLYAKGRWEFRDVPGGKRLETFHKVADLIAELEEDFTNTLVLNAGKTEPSARTEVRASVERLRHSDLDTRRILGDYVPGDWSEETIETEAVVRREPLGVVLAIVPFNYPLMDAVNKLVYSTIAGNAILIKPATSTPIPALMLAKVLETAGFPEHCFAVATVRGSEMGGLVSDKRIAAVSLTGSSKTGISVLGSAGLKQFVLELGGGDPAIVLDDAEVRLAAGRIVGGIVGYSGQRCDAIKLVLAGEPVYAAVRDEIAVGLDRIRVGDPREAETDMGPLIDEDAAREFDFAVHDAARHGGKVIAGGAIVKGNYVRPTLIEIGKEEIADTVLYRDEVFAPIALLTKVDSSEEAIKIANGRRYGLDAAIFGRDMNKIRRLTRMLEVGAVYINDAPKHGIGYFPFGGRKDSGIGREGIGYTIDHVTAMKSIIYNFKGKGIWEYL
jgi:glyceraldehyde-3-phosphate dehydrogenase [NAD(P)+]